MHGKWKEERAGGNVRALDPLWIHVAIFSYEYSHDRTSFPDSQSTFGYSNCLRSTEPCLFHMWMRHLLTRWDRAGEFYKEDSDCSM